MKTVTFISHYFRHETNIRLSDDKYNSLMHNSAYEPIELYLLDANRVSYGISPIIFSVGQIKRLHRELLGTEYWDKII